MITSFRNLTELKDMIVNEHATIISGLHPIKGDMTGLMAADLYRDGFEFCFAFGFFEGKYEPSLIIPNISVGHAISLAKKYDQASIIHDGLFFSFGETSISCHKAPVLTVSYAKDDPLQESAPFTEVIIESGKKARLRYS